LDAGGAAHGTGAPAAHVLVRALVDRRLRDEERVDVLRRVRDPSVRDGALDYLEEHGGAGLGGELEQLERLGGVFAAH